MGCPVIDKYINYKYTDEKWNKCIRLIGDYNIEKNNYIVMIFHIDTLHIEKSIIQYKLLFKLLINLNKQVICFYPNIDNTSKELIQFIDKEKTDNMILMKNLPQNEFITLIEKSALFIGNSSSLVREAPLLGVPTILIGKRQKNRLLYKSTKFFMDIDTNILLKTIKELYGKKFDPEYIYGNGTFKSKFEAFINKF